MAPITKPTTASANNIARLKRKRDSVHATAFSAVATRGGAMGRRLVHHAVLQPQLLDAQIDAALHDARHMLGVIREVLG